MQIFQFKSIFYGNFAKYFPLPFCVVYKNAIHESSVIFVFARTPVCDFIQVFTVKPVSPCGYFGAGKNTIQLSTSAEVSPLSPYFINRYFVILCLLFFPFFYFTLNNTIQIFFLIYVYIPRNHTVYFFPLIKITL